MGINVEELYQKRFGPGTGKRSDAYKDGYRAGLERTNIPRARARAWIADRIPYVAGTVEFDAWFAGFDHACQAVREMQDAPPPVQNGGW